MTAGRPPGSCPPSRSVGFLLLKKGKLVGVISLADLARSHRFDMEASQALCEISENIVVR